MFGLGMSEILFLGALALIVIGPKELPQLARTLGRFLNELKRTTGELTDELKQQAKFDPIDLFENTRKEAPKAPPEQPAVDVKPEVADHGDWSSPDHVPHGGQTTTPEPQQMELQDLTKKSDDDDKGSKG
ncbi:twin-arginine translocase TatA/TatE family subunit [Bdellovibrio sp. HCB274]|uniref:Sec-independent protein translocase subunit TatA/TatB n=1 Tax=Bdellovibrio sp. HCB274 TaxID=3394361 RepID=UPI0039B6CA00